MIESLRLVWEQVTDLLAESISVIPVRDKEQDGKPPKTPYASWKQYQTRRIEVDELWHAMEEHNTTAIAMICGPVSGNLEAIDIDVKNWPGIDARYFELIRDLYPDLWFRLRIHSTPSGGFHVLYRCEEAIKEGNQKLATRADSNLAGIETRGEGGYIVAPPSLGYGIHRLAPIPIITLEERESLINLARSLNEKVKAPAPAALPKPDNTYYDQNPFEAYNHSDAARTILTDHGWRDAGYTAAYLYFTRPDKPGGISASYHRVHGLYYIFTSSTGLEPDRGYQPATLLSLLQFGGDNRATYRWLVEQGYGRLKPSKERQLVLDRATNNQPLPANVSTEGHALYQQTQERYVAQYPHGRFWEVTKGGVYTIHREHLYQVAGQLGFRSYNGAVVRIQGYIVTRLSMREFYDGLKQYLGADLPDLAAAFEAFLQRAGEFTASRLPILQESNLLSSTRHLSYKFYRNGYLAITATQQSWNEYPAPLLIWNTQIQSRDFFVRPLDSHGLYYRFLDLAIGVSDYLLQILGYLCHEYKDESMGYIVILVEQCEDPKQGGGTGKNIFTSLLGHSTSLKNIAGVQVQFNERFLQPWNYERVLALSDIPKRFHFSFLKELSTGSGTLKKLFKDELIIPPHLMPKFILSTNYSYDAADGGLRRRLLPVEFSSFFTEAGGVDAYFGKLFPYDWDSEDWLQYDNLVAHAIQQYLAGTGKLRPAALAESGWLKQFDQLHMPLTRQFIQEHEKGWLEQVFVSHKDFKTQYDTFCTENGVVNRFRLTAYRMNQALQDWCGYHQIRFGMNTIKRENSILTPGRVFEAPTTPF